MFNPVPRQPNGLALPSIGGRRPAVRTGLRPILGEPLGPPPRPGAENLSSPLRDVMPCFRNVPFWFAQASITLPLALSGDQCVCIGLQRIDPVVIGQEFTLTGIDAEIRPCDTAGTAGASGTAWGTADGFGARLVVGRNLPFRQLFTFEACDFGGAGITGATLTTSGRINSAYGPDWPVREAFPPGALTDTPPNPKAVKQHFAEQYRIINGQTLDVAIFIRASTVFTGGSGTQNLYGRVEGSLRLGLTQAEYPWQRST